MLFVGLVAAYSPASMTSIGFPEVRQRKSRRVGLLSLGNATRTKVRIVRAQSM